MNDSKGDFLRKMPMNAPTLMTPSAFFGSRVLFSNSKKGYLGQIDVAKFGSSQSSPKKDEPRPMADNFTPTENNLARYPPASPALVDLSPMLTL